MNVKTHQTGNHSQPFHVPTCIGKPSPAGPVSRGRNRSPAFPLALLLCWLALLPSAGLAREQRPNILVILADDLGWGDLRCYNPASRIETPNLDRLAAEGLRFTDAHTPSAVCTPTRYGLLTGRYAWRTRLQSGVLWGYSPPLIDPGQATVASLLQSNGYRTACIGKWHLGLGWPVREPATFGDRSSPSADLRLIDYSRPFTAGPLTAGFDEFFGIPASLDMDPYVFIENDRVVAPPDGKVEAGRHQRSGGDGYWRAGPIAPGFTHEGCLPRLTTQARAFIRRQSPERPFFLYLPLTAPHDPWVPTAEFKGRSAAGAYGDFVMQMDAAVGAVLATLKDAGLSENTLVLFTSDNGAHCPPGDIRAHGHRANGHWRGQKSDAWEGGHRVPFLARWPGRIKPGTTSPALVCLTDLTATVAEAIGVPRPAGAVDSVSQLPVLLGRTRPARRSLAMHSINGVFAFREGPWKLIEAPGSGGWSEGDAGAPGQLYHLDRDPAEQDNLWFAEPRPRDRLRRELGQLRGTLRTSGD